MEWECCLLLGSKALKMSEFFLKAYPFTLTCGMANITTVQSVKAI